MDTNKEQLLDKDSCEWSVCPLIPQPHKKDIFIGNTGTHVNHLFLARPWRLCNKYQIGSF
jgi:hypothetical protein